MLKGGRNDYTIKWKVIIHARVYQVSDQKCQLCTVETFEMIKSKHDLINSRKKSILAACCRYSQYAFRRFNSLVN